MKSSRKGKRILSMAICLITLLSIALPALAASIVGYATLSAEAKVYESASTSASVLGTFSKGAVVAVESQDKSSTFYVVRLNTSDTSTGYILKSAVSKLTSSIPTGKNISSLTASASTGTTDTGTTDTGSSSGTPGVIYNCSSYVNFRAKASASSSKLGTIKLNTAVTILGEEGSFCKISYNGQTGYVSKDYVKETSSSGSTSGGTTTEAVSAQGLIKASTRLYKEANKTGGSNGTLAAKTIVEISGQTGDYYVVTSGTKTGYVLQTAITVLPTVSDASGTGTINASARMYAAASTSSKSLRSLSKKTAVTITGETSSFYRVTSSNSTGFVEKSKVTLDTTSSGSSGSSTTTGGSGLKVTPGKSSPSSTVSTALSAAKKKNSDVVGYIYIKGTNISQPILYRSGNVHYYSSRDINKKSSSAGSIYSFYSTLVRNNTITGHNMRGSNNMFHQLHHIQEKALGYSSCQTTDYSCKASSLSSIPNIKTDTSARVWEVNLYGYNKWQIWAMYEVKANEPSSTLTYNTNPLSGSSSSQIKTWIQYQQGRSEIDFGSSVATDDVFLTVYTCGTNYDSSKAQSRIYFFLKAVE